MKYNFKEVKKKKGYCGCSVGDKSVYLSKELKEKINSERVDLFIDVNLSTIAFSPNEEGVYKLTKQGKGYIVNVELIDVMGRGRFLYLRERDNKIICKK